ncbi:hypothetical protein SXCC_03255 [Gluconacetobacter sp. SXCC-1]|nr:hypothetical protein SXCC_03255 [Gluconacetobacter sp. SXCC-1]
MAAATGGSGARWPAMAGERLDGKQAKTMVRMANPQPVQSHHLPER